MIDVPELLAVGGPESGTLRLADGVALAADIYRPADGGDHPVLLMRQPYGRRIASTIVLAHPRWYAAHGYVVVVQDVRGCGGSGGAFTPLRQEIADGAASVDWARSLPGSNGRIGLYGFSYQASCQYLALAGGARPDAIAPAMGSWAPDRDWAFENGAFRLALNAGWAAQMALPQAERLGDHAARTALAAAAGLRAQRDLLTVRPDLSHLNDWMADDPAYWARVSPAVLLGAPPSIPALHVAGLYDFLLGGSLGADVAFRAVSPATTHLILGPWAHMPWNRAVGSALLGPGAELSVDRAQVAFFDHYLKGEGPRPAGVTRYDMGGDCWRRDAAWPMRDDLRLRLASTGLAATMLTDGRLEARPGAGADILVHDPDRPAPLVGGALGSPPGCVDRAAQDNRSDVAVYTTPPLRAPLPLCGPGRVTLDAQADAATFDLCATLSRVRPSGAALVLATGYARRRSPGPFDLPMGALSITLPAGDALRLSVQGAGAPAFGLAQEEALSGGGRARITIVLRHADCWLTLPVIASVLPVATSALKEPADA